MRRKKKKIIIISIILISAILTLLIIYKATSTDSVLGRLIRNSDSDEIHSEFTGEEIPDTDYTGEENDTGLKMKMLHDGFAGMAIPYPADYTISVYAANKLSFTSPDQQTVIYIEQAGSQYNIHSDLGFSLSDFLNEWKFKLKHESFEYTSDTLNQTLYRSTDVQDMNKPDDALKEENDGKGEELRIIQEYPDMEMQNSSGNDTGATAFERRYYIRKDGTDIMVSVLTFGDDNAKTQAKKLADFIVSNMDPEEESFQNTAEAPVSDSISLTLSKKFVQQEVSNSAVNAEDGTAYIISDGTLSEAAGVFVHIYNVRTDYDLSSFNGFEEFQLEFPKTAACIDDMSYTDTVDTKYNFVYSHLIKENKKLKSASDGAVYTNIPIYRTSGGGSYLFENGSEYTIEAFTVKDGKGMKLVTIGYFTLAEKTAENVIS